MHRRATALIAGGMLLVATACGSDSSDPLPPASETATYQEASSITSPAAGDYASKTYTEAFSALVSQFEQQYAFTEWKKIDFAALKIKYGQLMQDAESKKDKKAYAEALLTFVSELHDGHVKAADGEKGTLVSSLRAERVGGSYGYTAAALQDGTIVADSVADGKAAAVAGMKPGATIVAIGGLPTAQALETTPIIWADSARATNEDVLVARLTYVTRSPVGDTKAIAFQNPGATSETFTLTSYDDGTKGVPANSFNRPATFGKDDLTGSVISSKVVGTNIGYIKIKAMLDPVAYQKDDGTGAEKNVIKEFGDAVSALNAKNVKGIVVDARSNAGGLDSVGAAITGFWTASNSFYEYPTAYDSAKNAQVINTTETRSTQPQTPQIASQVVVLSNTGTISSGEGLALQTNKLSAGATTMGFWLSLIHI